ncbi:MAG TPA: PAS domain-containing protein, partial [Firmicutes bacterium]|nr:PAS domain-containing protein [Bacillota bacterium]
MPDKDHLHNNIDEAGFQTIFAGLMLPILLLDDRQRLVRFNQYAQEILQLDPATHLGQDITQALPWLAGRIVLDDLG